MNALEGNQGTCCNNNGQGEVQATVGALQARMIFAVRATHGMTTNSSETADGDIPEGSERCGHEARIPSQATS